ncbi:MAG TPA: hypothetical protein DCS11_01005 [Syntrophus sp. (in: bacteria)]|nr:hypothetical protein [Syntrophus sp. (in: bacteria)]
MCLILLAYGMHPRYRLILAANRDEFYARPSAAAAFWDDAPDLLAGRDLRDGGTWLGITRQGRFAALTNYRDPASLKTGAPSRGRLAGDFLRGPQTPADYLEAIRAGASAYNGFNLLVGDLRSLYFSSNRGGSMELSPGLYGLSNHLLNTPWPKVERGRAFLQTLLENGGEPETEALFSLLADRSRPADANLPDTGVDLAWERILSSIFITSPVYGTRSSTVLKIGHNGGVEFVERVFNGRPEAWMTSAFSFSALRASERSDPTACDRARTGGARR